MNQNIFIFFTSRIGVWIFLWYLSRPRIITATVSKLPGRFWVGRKFSSSQPHIFKIANIFFEAQSESICVKFIATFSESMCECASAPTLVFLALTSGHICLGSGDPNQTQLHRWHLVNQRKFTNHPTLFNSQISFIKNVLKTKNVQISSKGQKKCRLMIDQFPAKSVGHRGNLLGIYFSLWSGIKSPLISGASLVDTQRVLYPPPKTAWDEDAARRPRL